jgi:hypothetical protein
MDKITMGAYQEMLCMIKLVLDPKTNVCLKIEKHFDSTNSWNLKVFYDTDWAGDPETRISVTGFIVYLQKVPVGVQRSREASHYQVVMRNMLPCLKIRFIYFILCDVGIEVELWIVVKTENFGNMFMTQNSLTGVPSWHVDTRYHVVCKNVEDRTMKVEFVNSIENNSCIYMCQQLRKDKN